MPIRSRKSPQKREPRSKKSQSKLPPQKKEIRVIVDGRVRKAVVVGITRRKRSPIVHVRTLSDNRLHRFPLSKLRIPETKKPKYVWKTPAQRRMEAKKFRKKQKRAEEKIIQLAGLELGHSGKLSEKTLQRLRSIKVRPSKIKPMRPRDRWFNW